MYRKMRKCTVGRYFEIIKFKKRIWPSLYVAVFVERERICAKNSLRSDFIKIGLSEQQEKHIQLSPDCCFINVGQTYKVCVICWTKTC